MFKRVLVANRGEIAVRVLTACREMGIRAIAVYSDVDANAAHVRAADEAHAIGPAPARESYLCIPAILQAARASGAEAIHPGYGFLSENADFAEACLQAGIVFIGPTAEAIRTMGDKIAAKQAVESRGVPTVPGYAGAARDAKTLAREAERIGYPVMIKAAAGGGGKGMRVVQRPADFAEALGAAQREALAAFGSESIFLERLIVGPRHVEIQVLADHYGNTIHLGERECSIQRRHQKVIEESPSPALTPELRARMGQAAVLAAQSVGYINAGTCEFLLDESGSYFFLEMNTRLQVEHPVTEGVTGLDLVRLQLAIAAGEGLALRQDEITFRGHTIEARIYAEDPANQYLPSTGTLLAFTPPTGPGVRVDAGVATGDEVSMHYDPMLAKLIVSAPDRPAAIQRLERALSEFAILGVAHNIPLVRAIAGEPDFHAGRTAISYLETHQLTLAAGEPPREALAAAALWEALSAPVTSHAGPYNPWTSGVAASAGLTREAHYHVGQAAYRVTVSSLPTGGLAVTVDDAPLSAHPLHVAVREAGITVTTAEGNFHATVARRDYDVLVSYDGQSYTLARPRPLDIAAATHGHHSATGVQALTAPMAGTIISVRAAEGDQVEEHQTLVVLGAMKMEHAIVAPYAGTVRRVSVRAGDVVPGGQVLVELDANDE
jgi:3-methylcrotonyl-CoA carboxylase alpha subunit